MNRLLKLSIAFIAIFTLLVPPRILTTPAFANIVVDKSSATNFNNTGGCDFTNTIHANVSVACAFARISAFGLSLAADLLYRAGTMFDFAVNYGLNMAARLNDFSFVSNGWVVFRDVTNLAYIFILLYIAINIILGNSGYGDKSLIAKVLVTAVFVNFSLFGAKLIIDTTNIAALQFYNLLTPASPTDSTAVSATDQNSKSLTGQFMNLFALQTIYGNYGASSDSILNSVGSSVTGSNGDLYSQSSTWWNMCKLCVFGTLFVLAVTLVFFAGAFLFLSRTLVLFFLLVFSALAVASRALPSTKSHFDNWLKKLIDNAIFAPIFLGLIYIFVAATNTYKSPLNLANVILNGGNISGIVTFFMYLAFLTGLLLVAKQLGIKGGEFAHGVAEKYISPKGLSKTVGKGALAVTRRPLTAISESGVVKNLSSYVPSFMGGGYLRRGLASVRKVTGQEQVDKKHAENLKKEHAYLSKTTSDSPERKKAALHRANSTIGLNDAGKPSAFGKIKRLFGGKGVRDAHTAIGKKIQAEARSKERATANLLSVAQGVIAETGLTYLLEDNKDNEVGMNQLSMLLNAKNFAQDTSGGLILNKDAATENQIVIKSGMDLANTYKEYQDSLVNTRMSSADKAKARNDYRQELSRLQSSVKVYTDTKDRLARADGEEENRKNKDEPKK